MAKDQKPLMGDQSQQNPIIALGDLNKPLEVVGPFAEFQLGFFGPRDGEPIHFDAVACLAQDPTAAAAFVRCAPGSTRGSVVVSVFDLTTAPAAPGLVTLISLVAARGSSVAK